MTKRTLATICVAGMAACITTVASANGLLGENYLGMTIDSYSWGDSAVDHELGRSYGASAFGNYNLAENWDFHAAYSGLWDSLGSTNVDVSVQAAMFGLNYLFPSEQPVTPYIGGSAGFAHTKLESESSTDSQTDAAFGMQLGVEWDVCEASFLDLSTFLSYVDDDAPDNDGNYGIRVATGINIIEHLLLVGSVSYTFEEEDASASIGAVILY